jgi:integrase
MEALAHRPGFGTGDLTSESLVADVADRWLAEMQRAVADEARAPGTTRAYRSALDRHIRPGVGALQLREASVTRLDALVVHVRKDHGAGMAKTVRTVLSGIFGYAVRLGALPANPVRDIGAIRGGRKRVRRSRSLTQLERDRWLAAMEADEIAVAHDIPDLTRFLLATGARIGECLAATFEDVDRDDKTVAIDWNIVRITGSGLHRMPTKTSSGARTLRLPGWGVDMLIRRGDFYGWTGPVFPAIVSRSGGYQRRGGSWRCPSNTGRTFREARDRAGFDWVTPHVFRRTVATIMDESGHTGREIADYLGHSKVSMTQDHYLGRGVVGDGLALEDVWGPDEEADETLE